MLQNTHITGIASDGRSARQYTVRVNDDGTFVVETTASGNDGGNPHAMRWLGVTASRRTITGNVRADGRYSESAAGLYVNPLSRYGTTAKGAPKGAWVSFEAFVAKTLKYSDKEWHGETAQDRSRTAKAVLAQKSWNE